MKLSYRSEIDGLRAFAVSFVLLFHFFPGAFKGGFVGVDVFFVISGYLITKILSAEIASGKFSLIRFYGYRIRRIFPALLLVLLSSALYSWIFLFPEQYVSVAKYVAAGAGFISNFVLWSESGYFDLQAHQKPLMHLWSLGIEEQYYIFWPLILFLIVRYAKRQQIIVIGLLAFVSLAYSINATYHDSVEAFFSPLSRSWELMAGALLAANNEQLRAGLSNFFQRVASNVGFVLLLSLPFLVNGGDTFPGWQAIFPIIAALLLLLGGQSGWVGKNVLSHPAAVYIGQISYPLYLWHWVVLVIWKFGDPSPNRSIRIALLLISFVLAHLTFRYVEEPIRRRPVSLRLAGTLFLGMMMILIVSVSSYRWGFLVKEMSPVRSALSKAPDLQSAYRWKTCFLDSRTQMPDAFDDSCVSEVKQGERRLLIWGDSLAAQLYPGLNAIRDSYHLSLAQRTAGSCPPGLEADFSHNGNCDAINAATRQYISKIKPYAVVMNGRWENGERSPDQRIKSIVEFLKNSGVKKILLVGPAPRWSPDLRVQLLMSHLSNDVVPDKWSMTANDWSQLSERDGALAKIAAQAGVVYLSPLNEFCSDKVCEIRTSDNFPERLIVDDNDHMTSDGSIKFFISTRVQTLLSRTFQTD
jgi:peptidoglycan/LPS O-acetylase OafA/YrhL